jgi:hypothetical protein
MLVTLNIVNFRRSGRIYLRIQFVSRVRGSIYTYRSVIFFYAPMT